MEQRGPLVHVRRDLTLGRALERARGSLGERKLVTLAVERQRPDKA